MYIKIEENILTSWANWEFEGSKFVEVDCDEYSKTPTKWIVQDGELIENPDYETLEAQKSEVEFKKEFFEIQDIGWYRKKPKGYQSAVESMNTAFNTVAVLSKLPAGVLTFYSKPDFSDAQQRTQEWLVANSFKNQEMSASEFGVLFAQFTQSWNMQEHK